MFACVYFVHILFKEGLSAHIQCVLGGYAFVVYACTTCMSMLKCAYSRSDRLNPVACESELFMV